jgi:hypothetical protein
MERKYEGKRKKDKRQKIKDKSGTRSCMKVAQSFTTKEIPKGKGKSKLKL